MTAKRPKKLSVRAWAVVDKHGRIPDGGALAVFYTRFEARTEAPMWGDASRIVRVRVTEE